MKLLLALIAAAQAAAVNWQPSCSSRTDATLWFVLTEPAPVKGGKGPPPAPKDFECEGVFLGKVPCPSVIMFGKVTQTGKNTKNEPTYELKYLPFGQTPSILSFLDKTAGGVTYKPAGAASAQVGAETYAAIPTPPKPEALLEGWLNDRVKASLPTQGVGLHLWMCPEAIFILPEETIQKAGMNVSTYTANASLY